MFNNTALDIAIGLTFIFVLYSLLALTINEFLATIFAYRHRMLERALEQMLDGRSYGYYWWDKAINLILWLYYLIRELFSGQQNEELKSYNAFLSKTDLSNPEITIDNQTRFYYKRVKINEKSLLFTANVTDHPLYKRKAERSFFFKKPAYLSSDSFSDILIDILGKNRTGDTPTLLKDIAAFVNSEINNNPDLKKVLNLYIEQANGDLQRFKVLLENWFDDTMDRVTGWYKKQSYRRSIVIGFLLAMTFNVNTIHIVKKLSEDKDAREALVKNASEYVRTHMIDTSGHSVPLKNESVTVKPPAPDASSAQPDTNNKTKPVNTKNDSITSKDLNKSDSEDSLFLEAQKKLRQIDSLYKNDIAQNDSLLGLGWGDFGVTERKDSYKKDSVNYVAGKREKKPKAPDVDRTVVGKIIYVIGKTINSPLLFFGFLITAFAISLGAPFWFDLLSKLVNLRVAGAKPDTVKEQSSSSKSKALNQLPNPKAFG